MKNFQVTISGRAELTEDQCLLTDAALAMEAFPANSFTDVDGQERFIGEIWVKEPVNQSQMTTYRPSSFFDHHAGFLARDYDEPGVAVKVQFENGASQGIGTTQFNGQEVLTINQKMAYFPQTRVDLDVTAPTKFHQVGTYTLPNGVVVPCFLVGKQCLGRMKFRNTDQDVWLACEPIQTQTINPDLIRCHNLLFPGKIVQDLAHPNPNPMADPLRDLGVYLNGPFLRDLTKNLVINDLIAQDKLSTLNANFAAGLKSPTLNLDKIQ